jgi:hypothetical protein
MKGLEPNPPAWTEAFLRSLLRAIDRESISGDLLEEYRVARHPALGTMRANAWYIQQVLSLLWHLIRPYALTVVALTLVSLEVKGLWYGSVVQAPGVSLLDSLVYLYAGYQAARRTQLIRTGALAAGSTSFIGFTTLFTAVAIRTPSVLTIPVTSPGYLLMFSVLLLIAVGYGAVLGFIGGIIGRWMAARVPHSAQTPAL